MLRTGEGAVLHRLDVARDGRFNIAASGHEIAHEACELAGIDAEHIVENKHLTIAPRTGADADGRWIEFGRDLGRERRGNHLQHQHADTGGGEHSRLLAQRVGASLGRTLSLVAAVAVHRLRLETEVPAYRDPAVDAELDRRGKPRSALEL